MLNAAKDPFPQPGALWAAEGGGRGKHLGSIEIRSQGAEILRSAQDYNGRAG